MSTDIVLTLTGPDRVGIVEEVTRVLLGMGGNVETSRMARLGGDFAMLLLLSLPSEAMEELPKALSYLDKEGYSATWRQTERPDSGEHPGWPAYRVEIHGADHEGIVHGIARELSAQGISIESADSWVSRAPMSGAALFSMNALVVVPPELDSEEWQERLRSVAESAGVGLAVIPAD